MHAGMRRRVVPTPHVMLVTHRNIVEQGPTTSVNANVALWNTVNTPSEEQTQAGQKQQRN